MGELIKMRNSINDTLTPMKAKAIYYGPGPSDYISLKETRIQKDLKENISLLQKVESLVNNMKGDKYVLEEKDCLLKDLNASINKNEAKGKKDKG